MTHDWAWRSQVHVPLSSTGLFQYPQPVKTRETTGLLCKALRLLQVSLLTMIPYQDFDIATQNPTQPPRLGNTTTLLTPFHKAST